MLFFSSVLVLIFFLNLFSVISILKIMTQLPPSFDKQGNLKQVFSHTILNGVIQKMPINSKKPMGPYTFFYIFDMGDIFAFRKTQNFRILKKTISTQATPLSYGTVDNLEQDPRPQTLEQLKENIRRVIRGIPQETFPALMESMAVRMQSVIGRRGCYVDHVV